MFIKSKISTIIILLSCFLFSENDVEYWSQYELSKKVSEQLSFRIKPAIRFNYNLANHYWSDIAIGLDYRINYFTIISSYFRPLYIKTNNNWTTEYRPYLAISFIKQHNKLFVNDRNQLEFLIRNTNNSFRYRNKLTIGKLCIIQNKLGLNLSDEFFYDFYKKCIDMNRIYLDFQFSYFKNPQLGLCLIQQQNLKDGNWSNTNIFMTSIKYSI